MEIMSMPASNESDGQHHIMLANQNLNSESAETASDQAQGHEEEEEIDFRYKKGRDKPSDVRNVLLTVAVLLVAATYQAVYNPPGGLWQEDCPDTDHVAGVPPSAAQTNGRHPELGASTTARSKQVAGRTSPVASLAKRS
ncbi:uncharacterized protein LOC114713710 isoform X2 [Neltuma alba]|uniref:uncharacterized protein LOC114713710 isoform X2 n=1 Tax=Neltuma alba TaxID=207710 RepID=UPI0010A2D6C0|nr:uncharacterized protein LOC114713710 isoform X2 [Prosopis alba]